MIIVTGGAGFIGSNIVKHLNQAGHQDILVVDDLTEGHKFRNLVGLQIQDYMDKSVFLKCIKNNESFGQDIQAIFHEGACSDTTEWNGQFMMENNYEYSKSVFHYAIERGVPFLYASSAAVYGAGKIFKEEKQFESPLNVYGYSKYLFDQYVRQHEHMINSQVVGFRYFNVYGPNEQHKGSMASVAFHLNNQLKDTGKIKLFEGCDGYANGDQHRDFVYVDDVAAVNLWFMQNPKSTGIFNLGTGRSQPFNDIAKSVIAWHNRGELEYIPFPEHLKGCYQSFTQADISKLRNVGYRADFKSVEEGVKLYLDRLNIE